MCCCFTIWQIVPLSKLVRVRGFCAHHELNVPMLQVVYNGPKELDGKVAKLLLQVRQ